MLMRKKEKVPTCWDNIYHKLYMTIRTWKDTCIRTYVGAWGLCITTNQILMMIVEKLSTEKTMKSKAAGGCHYNTYECLRPPYQSHPFDITSSTEVCSPLNISIMKASHQTVSVSIMSQCLVLLVANPEANWTYLHLFLSSPKRQWCTWKDMQPVKLAYFWHVLVCILKYTAPLEYKRKFYKKTSNVDCRELLQTL